MSERIRAATLSLARAFSQQIIAMDGLLLLDCRQARQSGLLPDADPTEIEATLNKTHIADLLDADGVRYTRDELVSVGMSVLGVWAERIALRYPGKAVLFYLGGRDSIVLRFHMCRSGVADWLDVGDREFLADSRMEVFELRQGILRKI